MQPTPIDINTEERKKMSCGIVAEGQLLLNGLQGGGFSCGFMDVNHNSAMPYTMDRYQLVFRLL